MESEKCMCTLARIWERKLETSTMQGKHPVDWFFLMASNALPIDGWKFFSDEEIGALLCPESYRRWAMFVSRTGR
ncbi:hypothetical protein CKAN_02129000 [Cinnamomum micranthum f. kanehirae]|uniref:Uncharacterized protein n=1 Tax=Cinnamomum micranthum f. kanehirae TaxID=337451 RepID=A0A443PMW3_9MAGN|nr:hypothetical protein CKAN_02129000 [Cinnamomum micranthum f. kanehirae]